MTARARGIDECSVKPIRLGTRFSGWTYLRVPTVFLTFLLSASSAPATTEGNHALILSRESAHWAVFTLLPGLWVPYGYVVAGAISLFVVETLLILGLLWQRTRARKYYEQSLLERVTSEKLLSDLSGKRAEQHLRETEGRFRLVANSAPVMIWMSGTDKLCDFFNQEWLNFTGRRIEEALGEGWASRVHPEDLKRCLEIYSASFSARMDFEMEYRLQRFDGEYRWIIGYGVPRFESDGTFCGFIGTCVDITERKTSEESLHTLTGRLITAQEEERARLARELHDDFSQRLALIGIGLGQLWKRLPESSVEERASVLEMFEGTREMASDLHSLSHQLHSSKLEHVGLVPAINGLCKEISQKYKLAIRFSHFDVPQDIPKDVALCLFRVAQGALGNVVKHSESAEAQVQLRADAAEITLRISDQGCGFDSRFQNSGAGIGLIGMSERLRLVGGRLSVRSEPNRGTEILAEVPVAASTSETQVKAQAAGR
jgi:PAS domain S-box-containing protein